LKKRTKKLLHVLCAMALEKVFCFFFSKKKRFLHVLGFASK